MWKVLQCTSVRNMQSIEDNSAYCMHSANFANLHLRIGGKDSGNCCVAAQQAWYRNSSKAVLTLLRL